MLLIWRTLGADRLRDFFDRVREAHPGVIVSGISYDGPSRGTTVEDGIIVGQRK